MKDFLLGSGSLSSSRLAFGCWRLTGVGSRSNGKTDDEAKGTQAVLAACEAGYTLFDHADIYGDGVAEEVFGRILRRHPGLREKILIATKCGIRKQGDPRPDSPFRYDFSAEHIVWSCEQSLKRIGVETIDLYQLHRPDYLMNPEEVARAFTTLKQSGKVREFGVSNFRPSQVSLLQRACPMRLMVNQVEISLACLNRFEDGTIDQCLAERMTPLAWSPLAGGKLGNGARKVLPWQEAYSMDRLIPALDELAHAHGTNRTAVALAWLLRHPSGIVPIVGSTDPAHIREAAKAVDLKLSREEWYHLFAAARRERLP